MQLTNRNFFFRSVVLWTISRKRKKEKWETTCILQVLMWDRTLGDFARTRIFTGEYFSTFNLQFRLRANSLSPRESQRTFCFGYFPIHFASDTVKNLTWSLDFVVKCTEHPQSELQCANASVPRIPAFCSSSNGPNLEPWNFSFPLPVIFGTARGNVWLSKQSRA